MNNFFSKIWSIDEMKSSVLVFILVGLVGVGSYVAVQRGDIPVNISNIIIALVMTIGGVNAVGYFGNMSMSKSTNPNQQMQVPMQSNMYGSNMSGYNSYGSMGTMNQPMGMNQTMPVQSVPVATTQTSTIPISNVRPQDRGI